MNIENLKKNNNKKSDFNKIEKNKITLKDSTMSNKIKKNSQTNVLDEEVAKNFNEFLSTYNKPQNKNPTLRKIF